MNIVTLIINIIAIIADFIIYYYIFESIKTLKELQKEKRLVADRLDIVERKLNILLSKQSDDSKL